MRHRPYSRLDTTRSGGRLYTVEQEQAVLDQIHLHHVGAENAIKIVDLARVLGYADAGRTIRQVIVDHDGVDFLIGGGDDGLFICLWADESEGLTARLQATADTTLRRIERRGAYLASSPLPRRQPGLF